MEVDEVVEIWREGVTIEGVFYEGGLKQLLEEDSSRPLKQRKLSKQHKTFNRRIRIIATKVQELEQNQTSLKDAIRMVEGMRVTDGGSKLPLWKLAELISKDSSKWTHDCIHSYRTMFKLLASS